jgi:hypothetical protein
MSYLGLIHNVIGVFAKDKTKMQIEENYMNLTNKWFGNEQELNNFNVYNKCWCKINIR